MNRPLGGSRVAAAIALGILSVFVPSTGWTQSVLFVEGDRVSIGKNAPLAPLEVDAAGSTVGAGNSVVLLKNSGPLALQLDDTTVAGFWNFSSAANEGEFRISKSGTGRTELTLTSTGNLTIAGDIFTGSCAPCVPDHVFEPGYNLMPLTEVASYIEANGHLPNIASDGEYRERGGVALNELTVKLLEKVEELTLYTLQQQELINQLLAERDGHRAR